ncbi:MAG: ORF6N domain-containing protein [Gammaproteobacteria bacterium]|nr:ORF6N domain-containing protein [Gammaproteobacteria bacterium]
MEKDIIPIEQIEGRIYTLRGKRVMLVSDLAELYGVATKRLNEQVRRNADRFPKDFSFEMENQDVAALKSQIATSNDASAGRGGRRYRPRVFTEHGAIMAASVLNSPRAVEVSVFVVRAFVQLRELALAHTEIRHKLNELEHKVSSHDQAIAGLINAIRELMTPPDPKKKRPIGFAPWHEGNGDN